MITEKELLRREKISRNNARYWLGKKRPSPSKETLLKRSASLKEVYKSGKRKAYCSEETRQKISEKLKGRAVPLEVRQKISNTNKLLGRKPEVRRGENHWNWIKDRSKVKTYHNRREDSLYKQWRIEVYSRDSYKCKIANQDCNGRLEAHHILSFTSYPELRYSINNGITLCHAHHPRKRVDEQRLIPFFQSMVEVKI